MDELLGEFWRRPQRLSNLNTLHFADSWPVKHRGVLFCRIFFCFIDVVVVAVVVVAVVVVVVSRSCATEQSSFRCFG